VEFENSVKKEWEKEKEGLKKLIKEY